MSQKGLLVLFKGVMERVQEGKNISIEIIDEKKLEKRIEEHFGDKEIKNLTSKEAICLVKYITMVSRDLVKLKRK